MDSRTTFLACLSAVAVVVAAVGCEQSPSNTDAPRLVASTPAPPGSEWHSDGPLDNLGSPSDSRTLPSKGSIGDVALSQEPIGVPACDSYVDAVNRCYIPSLDAERRDEVLAPLKQLRFRWKQAATDAKGDARALALLAKTCDGVLEAEKTKLSAAGCWARH